VKRHREGASIQSGARRGLPRSAGSGSHP
jgi:hypothetical protein